MAFPRSLLSITPKINYFISLFLYPLPYIHGACLLSISFSDSQQGKYGGRHSFPPKEKSDGKAKEMVSRWEEIFNTKVM